MTNTYAINTTRGKEFEVEQALKEMGGNPWVPRQLCVKHVKERKEPVWYDRPYVAKLMFCVFPAVLYRDVCEHKHVIGKPLALSQKDVDGTPERWVETASGNKVHAFKVPGLKDFKSAVDAEYRDMQRKRENSEWVCAHNPGDALRILEGPFDGFEATFVRSYHDAVTGAPVVTVEVDVFGRGTKVQLAPNYVEIA